MQNRSVGMGDSEQFHRAKGPRIKINPARGVLYINMRDDDIAIALRSFDHLIVTVGLEVRFTQAAA